MFSFGIIAENFEVFANDIFDCKVLTVRFFEGKWKFTWPRSKFPFRKRSLPFLRTVVAI